MFKKFLMIFVLVFSSVAGLFSQSTTIGQELNAITTGVPFLTISPDARSGALGDAGVASSPDANSIHWNPAKYAFIDQDISLNLSYIPWLRNLVKDINFQNLSGSYRLNENQTIAASLMYFSLGNITFTNIAGQKIMDFKPNEFSFDVAYALKLSENIAGGIAFRYVHSNLTGRIPTAGSGTPTKPGNAFAGDISFFYTKDINLESKTGKFNFGVNISNLGSKISYSDDSYYDDFLPANLRVGAAFQLNIDEYNSITALFDINKLLVPTPPLYGPDTTETGDLVIHGYEDDVSVPVGIFQSFYDAPAGFSEEMHEIMFSGGLEYWYVNQFAIRAGYFHEHGTKGNRKYFTMGIGVKLNVLGFDFAYVVPTAGRQNPLANTLRFTLGFNMANLKN